MLEAGNLGKNRVEGGKGMGVNGFEKLIKEVCRARIKEMPFLRTYSCCLKDATAPKKR